MFDPIGTRIEFALTAMNALPPVDTPELDALFARLRTAPDARQRAATEHRIWLLWCAHRDNEATRRMRSVIDAFEVGDWTGARETLDALIDRWPEWAEAWNKRATLHFAEDRDADSLDDIARTLACEPRHFGALGGLGRICLRTGHATAALMAFERVLTIDPGLEDVRKTVQALRKETRHAVH